MDHLQDCDAWQVIEESYEDEELTLIQDKKNKSGIISITYGEVWCLSKATFFNEESCFASSMCRGDSCEGPLLWSVINNNRSSINLILPPAPDLVLKKDGPEKFSKNFKTELKSIFPMVFEVVPKFEMAPNKRIIKIYFDGFIEVVN